MSVPVKESVYVCANCGSYLISDKRFSSTRPCRCGTYFLGSEQQIDSGPLRVWHERLLSVRVLRP